MWAQLAKLKRPYPPPSLLDPGAVDDFIPAPDVAEWAQDVFVDPASKLFNPDHSHLALASLGVLWTNVANERKQRPVVGQAELTKPKPMQGRWEKAARQVQLRNWFGDPLPEFLITLYAPYAAECDNAAWCALVEHEMYHCRLLGFTSKGIPMWTLVGHDVEEHVGIVARYGPGAAAGQTLALVEAARRKPLIARARIDGVCGNCLRLAA